MPTGFAEALRIQGWMTPAELAFLQAIAYALPPGARMAEIGVWKGRSSIAICAALESNPGARLLAVDTFQGDPDVLTEMSAHNIEEEFKANSSRFVGMVDLLVAPSVEAAKQVDDGSLDCIFIDANHAYASALEDIRAWAPKLRRNGLMCGHDFGRFGLTLAVRQCYGRSVSQWETIWFTRSPCRTHRRFWLEAATRRITGRL